MTIGEMVRMTLTKLEWFGTLFPRFPLNIQRQLEEKIKEVQLAARYVLEYVTHKRFKSVFMSLQAE